MLPLLLTLFQAAPSPPVPPPPPESLAAATLLWAAHSPSDAAKQMAIDNAVAEATNRALYRVGIQASPKLSVTKAYIAKYDQLKPLIARHVPSDQRQLDAAVAACAMEQVARLLLPAEIAEVQQSLSTAAGRKFWDASGLTYWPLLGCYGSSLRLEPTDADYRAIGLRPPKPPKAPKSGTTFWS